MDKNVSLTIGVHGEHRLSHDIEGESDNHLTPRRRFLSTGPLTGLIALTRRTATRGLSVRRGVPHAADCRRDWRPLRGAKSTRVGRGGLRAESRWGGAS